MLGPLKWVGLGLATLLFLFFVTRHLRKREGEALAEPELAARDRAAACRSPSSRRRRADRERPTLVLPPRDAGPAAQALEELVDREPERVAAQVRAWMAED